MSRSQAVEATPPTKENRAAAGPAAPRPFLRPLRGRMLEWLADIVIVFVGVSAAFVLNAWQTQRQDRVTRLQIPQSLDEDTAEAVGNIRAGIVATRAHQDEWRWQLAAGEIPALHLLSFSTDYDPTDDMMLSQAGAGRLLDFQMVRTLKKASSVQRLGFMTLRRYQQLSYELIAPRLDDPKEIFYDPQTRKLKPMFAWYQDSPTDTVQFMQDSLAANEALLAQVRAERVARR